MTKSLLTQEEKDWYRKAYWYEPPNVISNQIHFYKSRKGSLSDIEKEKLEVFETLQKEMKASAELKKYHKVRELNWEIKSLEYRINRNNEMNDLLGKKLSEFKYKLSKIRDNENNILKWAAELNRLRVIDDN